MCVGGCVVHVRRFEHGIKIILAGTFQGEE